MKSLFSIAILTLAISAQAIAPEAVFLTDAQINRLNGTQARITLAQKELEAATEVQKRVLAEIERDLSVKPETHEPLAVVDGKWGFKKKSAEKE